MERFPGQIVHCRFNLRTSINFSSSISYLLFFSSGLNHLVISTEEMLINCCI